MNMHAMVGFVMLGLVGNALAQSAPPKVGGKPLVQVKPKSAAGCKLVGAVKGTKIWAGECTDAVEFRGASPATAAPAATLPPSPATAAPAATLPDQAAGAIPPGQK